jgi:prepilin-type N-terminal cleavage/methylation domain-containing protein
MSRAVVGPSRRRRRGFTLIEALAALLLVAIVLPVVMRGVSVGTTSASHSRRRTEAASLAQSKLAELVAGEGWRTGPFSGTFDLAYGDSGPEYAWRAEVRPWNEPYVQQLDVYVTWSAGAGEQFVTLSTLVYEGRPKEEEERQSGGTNAGTGGGT